MATLQKFKLLATQCAVAGSPTRSPSASPVIHLRRRKTLRMLLSRPQRRHGLPSHEIHGGGGEEEDPPKKKDARARRKLKDLFVSSPPPPVVRDRVSEKRDDERRDREEEQEQVEEESPELGLRFFPAGNGSVSFGVGLVARRFGAGSLRSVTSSGFRYRFLRRAWRPVLVSIPE